jgi:hypothetical protein
LGRTVSRSVLGISYSKHYSRRLPRAICELAHLLRKLETSIK